MVKQIFVNLPVRDLEKTKAFFSALGFHFNPKFTDSKAACLVLGEHLYAMLLKEEFFKTFVTKDIANAMTSTEVINALNVESKQVVDDLVAKAVAAGGKDVRKEDHGWMYGRAFEDLDGHTWEVFWQDEAQFQKAA